MIFAAEIIFPITTEPITNGALLVENGKISDIGVLEVLAKRYPGEEIRNFQEAIILPGLINLHGHLEYGCFSDLAIETPFSEWLPKIIQRSAGMTRADWIDSARGGLKSYFKSGITCSADISRSGAGLQAMLEAQMPGIAYIEAVAIDKNNISSSIVEILERIKSGLSMIDVPWLRIGLSPHSLYTLSAEALKVCAEISREYQLPLTMHIAESIDEVELVQHGKGILADRISQKLDLELIKNGGAKMSPLRYLDSNGLLSGSTVLAHGVWLNEEDIELIRSRNSSMAICCASNQTLQAGEVPLDKLLKANIHIGFGTDSCASNSSMNMFKEAKLFQELFTKQSKASKLYSISIEKLFELMTISAARILNLENYVGSLEKEKRADFIVIRLDRSKKQLTTEAILQSALESSVAATYLGGNAVYER